MGTHFDFALHAVNMLPHDVKPEAASGNIVNRLGGAEAGMKQEVEQLLFIDAFQIAVREQPVFQGAISNPRRLDALPVVFDHDDDAIPFLTRRNYQGAGGVFAAALAFFRRFNAMMKRVLH